MDQNVPLPALDASRSLLPPDIELASLHEIDPRRPPTADRALILWLARSGWDGLITNNDRMLHIPSEVAAVIDTKSVLVAVSGLGHDPVRAVGAVLLDIPDLHRRLIPRRDNVFLLTHRPRTPRGGWDHLTDIASRTGTDAQTLWDRHRPSPEERSADLPDVPRE